MARCAGGWTLACTTGTASRIKRGIPRPACTKVPETGGAVLVGERRRVVHDARWRQIKKGIPRPACTKVPKTGFALAYAGRVPILLPGLESLFIAGCRAPGESHGAICGATVHQLAARCTDGAPRCVPDRCPGQRGSSFSVARACAATSASLRCCGWYFPATCAAA